MKRAGIVTMLMLVIGAMIVSPAAAFSLAGGYLGPVEFKLTGFSKSLDNDPQSSVVDETWGIFQITSITTQGGSNLWSAGTDGEYIYGMFYGLTDINFVPNGSNGVSIFQRDGSFDLFLSTQAPVDIGGTAYDLSDPNGHRTATDAYDSVTNIAGASNFFSGNFAPGIIAGDNETTVFQDLTAATSPASGQGTGYGDITAGSGDYAALFNTDGFNPDGTSRDLLFDFFVSPTNGGPSGEWDQRITDPVSANAVPEPATMVLFGAGLIGAAARRKRKV